jgi:hypothetical protein
MGPNETAKEDGLTKQQIEFAIWLTQTGTINRACKVSKVPIRTAHKWMLDPVFLEEYRRTAAVAAGIARTRLETGIAIASDLLVETVADDAQDITQRLRAAELILKYTAHAEADSNARTDNPTLEMVRRPSDAPTVPRN